jgi:hypothetical protein
LKTSTKFGNGAEITDLDQMVQIAHDTTDTLPVSTKAGCMRFGARRLFHYGVTLLQVYDAADEDKKTE